MNNIGKTKKLVFAGLLVAMGILLPIMFHTIPNAGSVFLPMHIPVLLAGFITGPIFGLLCGILTPLISSIATGMPPAAILPSMICELAVYGFATGFFYNKMKFDNETLKIYLSLIFSMLLGRVTYGILNALIFKAGAYSLNIWLTAAFAKAIPGILIQLIIIPVILLAVKKAIRCVKS